MFLSVAIGTIVGDLFSPCESPGILSWRLPESAS